MAYETPREAEAAIDAAHQRLRDEWLPPPDLTVSQCAEAYRIMPKGTTARPGAWRTETYQREMMDVFDDPNVHQVVVVKPTQIGWSEILNNVVLKHIILDPKPMLLVQPSLDDAKGYAKKRITPMIEATPELKKRIVKATARRSGNTILLKEFAGGFLKLTGANSGKGLRSDAVPIVLFDEVEAYPDDVDGEGNPIDIGANRTESYSDFKILMGSTPAKPKGQSRLEAEWLKSDRRRFHVPCPHCGHKQVLWWKDPETGVFRLTWQKDANGDVIPSSVAYICASCTKRIYEKDKQRMLDGGHWVAECPGRAIVGFHINALYRPWKENWAAMAQSWVDAQGDNDDLKEFINLQLAEFWDYAGEAVDESDLAKKKEDFPPLAMTMPEGYSRPWEYAAIPAPVGLLTCTFDVQKTRVEGKIKGHGANGESWLIAHEVFWGDPSADEELWEQVDEFRLTERRHESGARLRPILTLVDSGDQTDAVYDYVQPRQTNKEMVFASKGVPFHTTPALVKEGTAKRHNIRLYTIATHAAKERIFSRLRLAKPGPGYMHFPRWVPEEYFKQLTSEKRSVVRDKKTRVKKVKWISTYDRNEALDLEVMHLAAVFILQKMIDPIRFADIGAIAAALNGEAPLPPHGKRRRQRSEGMAA